ncbi:aromatic amino acid transport family protein [Kistimonas asteriae]|uniref:aromatic amino acid transport family protein n=1 Tax=Kistimonas asteriae TaxID=517724 RepID=UPI001BA5D2E9|nr:aromatic amino acid transport family protein [Kistimonas asteriae]
MQNRLIGSALIIAGTSLGAGMIAMPLATAVIGFWPALVLMVFNWALATYSGLLVAEVCRACPGTTSLYGASGQLLGRPGQFIASLATLFLPYALCAAYITGAAGHLNGSLAHWFSIALPQGFSAICVTALFAGVIVISTSSVDLVTRGLFMLKVMMLVMLIGLLLPKVEPAYLNTMPVSDSVIWAALPLFFTSFGFQATVPSIVRYLEDKPAQIRPAVIIGSTLPLIIYLLWVIGTNGVLPQGSLVAIQNGQDPVSALVIGLTRFGDSVWISTAVNLFAILALATSFLGVALGLFDYIAEAFRRNGTFSGRLQTAVITFVPPLLVALYFPNSFITALGFAAIALVVLAVALPVVMVWRLCKSQADDFGWIFSSKAMLILAVVAGILIILAQLAVVSGMLPSI